MSVHASVFDRLEWLFALDETTQGCDGRPAPGKPVLCAQEIASHGLVPELLKEGCLEPTDWGYRLTTNQQCVAEIGARSGQKPDRMPICRPGESAAFTGMNYIGALKDTDARVVKRNEYDIPYPRCVRGRSSVDPSGP